MKLRLQVDLLGQTTAVMRTLHSLVHFFAVHNGEREHTTVNFPFSV